MERSIRRTIEDDIIESYQECAFIVTGYHPDIVSVYFLGKKIIISSRGISPLEAQNLPATVGGRKIDKVLSDMRRDFYMNLMTKQIERIVACKVLSIKMDLTISIAEKVDIFIIEQSIEEVIRQKEEQRHQYENHFRLLKSFFRDERYCNR
ncbi:Na-translocating system protein MpsC family protein [Aneurinibacillus danicus]|uniref:Na+-translocating membrane potential-generating system MpsC domain-containing protein n=1 Tax=Aneurinibacillus danicus TaxID=267746 RepID=A0A511VCR4_9BACL|nr:Na-translocating system protein MpsC family protein [Aneurinibacillus danicus]GEN36649.1 hypothetical protein ADA01nite_41090 [Aneurinibacillus danicus]